MHLNLQGYPEEWGCAPCRDFELAVVGQLGEAGITVDVRHADDHPGPAFDPGSDIDLVQIGTGSDYPDPGAFLGGLFDDVWLGSDNLAELDGIRRLYGDERTQAAAAFADRLVKEDYLIIPTGHQLQTYYLSERLGCAFIQPAIKMVDLLRLCVGEEQPAAPSSPTPAP